MPLRLLQFKPGIVKDITEYSAGKNGPFYVDCDKVRFKNGYPSKIGGWQKQEFFDLDTSGSINFLDEANIDGIPRSLAFWRSVTDQEDYLAVGTSSHLYIIKNDAMYDITPLRDSTNQVTTAAEAIDSSETSIDVTSVTGLKTAGVFKVGDEIITYTGISSTTLTGCTRGTNSTSAASHDNGATVTQIVINPIATTDGSTTVTITDNAHGAADGDYVVLSNATATGGISTDILNRKTGYEINLIDTNSYSITVPSAATSTVSAGGGLTVIIDYLIGSDDGMRTDSVAIASGWGASTWGRETWNTPRTLSGGLVTEITQWSLNLWGEDLLATVRGDDMYYWDLSGGVTSRAVLVSSLSGAAGVPTATKVTSISFPDRHFIAGGTVPAGGSVIDPMLVRFSDQEDFADFTPTATNTSGSQRLEIGTKIVAIVATRDETFISTDEAVYGMNFIGPPFTFSFRLVGTNCGSGGKNLMFNVDNRVFWMGQSNFFIYDGSVRELRCSVQHFVYDRLNRTHIDKGFVAHNNEFDELLWFYVSTSNTDDSPEPDSYVSYNYADDAWAVGTLDRTCWHDAFGSKDNPFAFNKSGVLYNHEIGFDDDGSAMTSFIESSPLEIDSQGNEMMLVDKVIPNLTLVGSADVTVSTRKHPSETAVTKGPFTITPTTPKINIRARGRQMKFKVESDAIGDSWSLGDFRVNTRQDGLR